MCVESALPNWNVKHLTLWKELVDPVVNASESVEDVLMLEETTAAAQFCEIKSKIGFLIYIFICCKGLKLVLLKSNRRLGFLPIYVYILVAFPFKGPKLVQIKSKIGFYLYIICISCIPLYKARIS